MWLISLIILALLAFFIVKYITSQSERKRAEQERLVQTPGIKGSLDHQTAQAGSGTTTTASPSTESVSTTAGPAAHTTTAKGASATSASIAAVGAAAAGASHLALDSGNTLEDVREMIKILNLAEPDATRLAITPEQLRALRNADTSAMPAEGVLDDLADRLRKMLA